MSAVVEAITASRNCRISSSSSSRSCNSSSNSICIFMLSLLKNGNSDGGDNSKIHLRFLASIPKLRITTVMRHRLKSYNVSMLSLRAALRLI